MTLTDELEPLHQLADKVRDEWSSDGFKIVEALEQHRAFSRNRRPQSAMARNLLQDLIERNGLASGVMTRTTKGAVEILVDLEGRVLVFRMHRARRDADGNLVILGPASGELWPIETETLQVHERWAFAFILGEGDDLGDLVGCRVYGVTNDTAVNYLILGPETPLGHKSLIKAPTTGARFDPADEGLDDDFDEDVREDGRNDASDPNDAQEGPSAAGA